LLKQSLFLYRYSRNNIIFIHPLSMVSMPISNVAAIVHIKSDYESWEKLMLNHADNQDLVDSGEIIYGKASDNKAILVRYNVDLEEMAARAKNPEFQKIIENDVERHEFYILEELKPPSS